MNSLTNIKNIFTILLQEAENDAKIGESISLNDDLAEVKNDTTATDDDFTRVFTHNNQDETILQDVERFSLDFDLPQENETAPGPWLNQTSGKIVSAISQKVSSWAQNSLPYLKK